jgi:hypothetical protein
VLFRVRITADAADVILSGAFPRDVILSGAPREDLIFLYFNFSKDLKG